MNEPTGYTALDLIGYTDKGDYSAVATYVKNDLVNYGGSKWRCKIDDTTAVTPTEGVNWTVFVAIPADTTKQIIAPVEGATSLHAYAVGKQLIYNDTLYKVTAAISIGDALVVGTNITASDTVIEQVDDNASEIDDLWDTTAQNGAHNHAPCTASSTTVQGVVYSVDTDGNVTTTWSSTPTGVAGLEYTARDKMNLIAGIPYKLSGCPTGGAWGSGNNKYCIQVSNVTDNTLAALDIGDGAIFTPVAGKSYKINIFVGANAGSSGNIQFKPQVTLASDHYKERTPYAMTNRELTETCANTLTLEAGTNISITRQDCYKFADGGLAVNVNISATDTVATGSIVLTLPSGYVFDGIQDILAIKQDSAVARIACSNNTRNMELRVSSGLTNGQYIHINGVARIKKS